MYAEFAATVGLVVEVVFVEELIATLLESAFAPVLCPEEGAFYGLLGCKSSLVDLIEALPTGGGEGGGKVRDAECFCLEGSGGEADAEALQTTPTAFGLMLETLNLLEPLFVVIIAVNPWDVEAVGMAFALVLADIVFFAWVDVGIEVKDGRTDVVLEHPLDNGGGAGGTTSVEED